MVTETERSTDPAILCWSVGRSRTTATWAAMKDQSWQDFIEWLDPGNPAATKEVTPYVGGTLDHGRRTAKTVEHRYLLTLDADYADEDFPLDVATVLVDTPYLLHTTWRHTPEQPRYRLIIPLDRATTPNEYKELAWAVMDSLVGNRFDKTTAQAERFMWGPSTQDEELYRWQHSNQTAPHLPVDKWLRSHSNAPNGRTGQGGPVAPTHTPTTVSGAPTAPVVTDEDRDRALEILLSACEDVVHLHERGKFSGRNEAVFHLLPLLLQFSDAGAIEEDMVLDALWNAALEVPADEPYTRQEFESSVHSARKYAEEEGPTLPETTATRMAQEDFSGVEEDVDLWSLTPQLQHIAQAADSMGRNRLALLAVVLTRVLVEVDPGICLPGVKDGAIGSRAPLNLGVALVGASGQGKTTFRDESEDLLGRDQSRLTREPSTGQGLIQQYLEWDDDLKENVLVAEPKRLFIVDEVDKLGALSGDSTSTLLAELRTFLSGSSTGSANATKERNRMLHARTYNFQLVVGVQPSRSGALLSSRDAGTPQRFIWANVTDPKNALHPDERPPWPGSMDWNDAFLLGFELGSPIVEYPEWLKRELRDYDYKVSLEGPEGGPMSRFGHQNLLRLKVSAGIAFLHESPRIEDLHVGIADQVIAASKRVQVGCERVLAENTFLARKAVARSEERVRDELGQDKLRALVKNARGKLLVAKGDWVRWQELRPQHRDRAEWSEPLWEALEHEEDIETDEEHNGSQVRRKARLLDEID